jgi:DNA uptake protein ComE-like DNA-binding protein
MGLSDWLTAVTNTTNGGGRSPKLHDPYYRFQSLAEVEQAVRQGVRIDANRAEVDDWLRLPGVSIHQARSLVALRQGGVQFHCLEDLAAALNVPGTRLQPFREILQFCYYDPDSPCTIQAVNANTATVEALSRIPQVDFFLARAIVQHRQKYGRYSNLADLQQRLRLPANLTADLLHYLKF